MPGTLLPTAGKKRLNAAVKTQELSVPPRVDLDSVDRRILDILQRDNHTSQQAIGEAVNLSAPAVQRRIKRLEESGVIASNVAVIDPLKVGLDVTVLVEISLDSERADRLDQTREALSKAPEVQQCYYVTGEADFMLVVVVPTLQEYEALTQRLFFADPNVRRFRSFVVMNRVKAGSALNLPA
jgi:DNA-binding Lrp family transcriptional regulator